MTVKSGGTKCPHTQMAVANSRRCPSHSGRGDPEVEDDCRDYASQWKQGQGHVHGQQV